MFLLMSDSLPKASLLSALLAFRVIYYLLPLPARARRAGVRRVLPAPARDAPMGHGRRRIHDHGRAQAHRHVRVHRRRRPALLRRDARRDRPTRVPRAVSARLRGRTVALPRQPDRARPAADLAGARAARGRGVDADGRSASGSASPPRCSKARTTKRPRCSVCCCFSCFAARHEYDRRATLFEGTFSPHLVHRRAARGRGLGRPRRVRVPQRAVFERVLLALFVPRRSAARLARDRRRRRRAARRRCPSAAAAGDAHRASADGRGHGRRRARHCDAEVELAVPRVPRRQGAAVDRRPVGVPDVCAARTHVGRAPRSRRPAARRADSDPPLPRARRRCGRRARVLPGAQGLPAPLRGRRPRVRQGGRRGAGAALHVLARGRRAQEDALHLQPARGRRRVDPHRAGVRRAGAAARASQSVG